MNPNNTSPLESRMGTNTLQPIRLAGSSMSPLANRMGSGFDTKSPQGLYDIAIQSGLQREADNMIRRAGGENQEYLSGGFIMDTMDILNTFSYGMVGLVKGKGFTEGVKNRESLSDEDALGS